MTSGVGQIPLSDHGTEIAEWGQLTVSSEADSGVSVLVNKATGA